MMIANCCKRNFTQILNNFLKFEKVYLALNQCRPFCLQMLQSCHFPSSNILSKETLFHRKLSVRMPTQSSTSIRRFHVNQANFTTEPTEEVDAITYEKVCEDTLDSLCEFFEDIVEKFPVLKLADVAFGDGVLTVNLDKFGTYVINRQSPNKQIWLSSPSSGPKRYDFVPGRNTWIYRHNNQSLHSLLQQELTDIVNSPVDLSKCAYCGHFK